MAYATRLACNVRLAFYYKTHDPEHPTLEGDVKARQHVQVCFVNSFFTRSPFAGRDVAASLMRVSLRGSAGEQGLPQQNHQGRQDANTITPPWQSCAHSPRQQL